MSIGFGAGKDLRRAEKTDRKRKLKRHKTARTAMGEMPHTERTARNGNQEIFLTDNKEKYFSNNGLTSKIERGIIGINKDVHAIFIDPENQLFGQGGDCYGEEIYRNAFLCTGTHAVAV